MKEIEDVKLRIKVGKINRQNYRKMERREEATKRRDERKEGNEELKENTIKNRR